MIERRTQTLVEEALRYQAAVALIGPRQVGKTTLAFRIAEKFGAIYLDLEDSEDRAKLSNPALYLDSMEDRLVILDEIHRVPELFQTLRGVIDKGRRKGKGVGRFLILGSASIDLMKQSGEVIGGTYCLYRHDAVNGARNRAGDCRPRTPVVAGRVSEQLSCKK